MSHTSKIAPFLLSCLSLVILPTLQAEDVLEVQEVRTVHDLQEEEIQKVKETHNTHKHQKHNEQSALENSSEENSKAVKTYIRYGQHSRFWDEVNSLSNSADPVGQTLGFMDKENYGAIEGIGKIHLELLNHNEHYWTDTFDTVGMGFAASSLAGGEVYNRISPRIRGYLTWDLSFFGSLAKKEVGIGESGWNYLVGSTFGIGRQKLVEGEAVDFLIKAPITDSTIYYVGLDFELGHKSQYSDAMRFEYKGLFLPTFFYSQFDDRKYTYGVKSGMTTYRWRTEFEQTYAFQAPTEGGFEIGGQLFGGQQPTPVRVLPRIWDSVHKIKFFPEYSTLIGVGAVTRLFTGDRNLSLDLYGGYYGGYFGGGGVINVYGVKLEGGSFGHEQTSNFNVRESRILYGSLGFDYEW